MKRVDFDPNGNRNIQNRGISGYERISWDERPISSPPRSTASSAHTSRSICTSPSSHHMWAMLATVTPYFRFMNFTGFTYADTTPIAGRLALGACTCGLQLASGQS